MSLSGENITYASQKPDEMKTERISTLSVVVALICFLINFTDGFDIVAMSVAAPLVAYEFELSASMLGGVFSAALVGMALGATVLSSWGDRWGRKKIILISIAMISSAMIATAFIQSIPQLLVLRFITGLGVGGVLGSTTSIASEYAPARLRSFVVIFSATGFTLGTVIVGPIASVIIEVWGWREIFLAGGGVGLLVLVISALFLPESLDFLMRSSCDEKLRLKRINRLNSRMYRAQLDEIPSLARNTKGTKPGVLALFRTENRKNTLLLWGLFFAAYWAVYLLLNWIPQLFVLSGFTLNEGITALSVLTFGGLVGAWILGLLSARVPLNQSIAILLGVAALTILLYVFLKPGNRQIMVVFMFLIGFTVCGGMTSLYGLAANLYALDIRATGVGWGIGVGRLGAVVSPVIAGILVDQGWGVYMLLLTLGVPATIIAGALSWMSDPIED